MSHIYVAYHDYAHAHTISTILVKSPQYISPTLSMIHIERHIFDKKLSR